MLTTDQVQQFERDGCLIGGRVLDDGQVAELRDALTGLIDKGPDGFTPDDPQPVLFRNLGGDDTKPVWQIVNIWQACEPFRRLVHHRPIVEAMSQLTGADLLQVWHDQIQYKPAGTGGVNRWHQDAPYWPIIRPMTPVSAWIALDDVDQDNGCMWMVPGSHLWGDRIDYLHGFGEEDFFEIGRGFDVPADSPAPEVKAVPWPVRAGEVSFHHSLTWHGSFRNTSGRPRRAIAVHYMTGEATYRAEGEHVMKPFVQVADGGPMREAGDTFPIVWRDGRPVEPPAMVSG